MTAARGGVALHWRILLGLVAGGVLGVAANALGGSSHPALVWLVDNVAQPAGQVFLRLIFMVVVPLVFSALVLGVVEIGDLTLDRPARVVLVRGEAVHLAGKEFELLCALAQEPHRVFTKDELLRDVWGFRSRGKTRTLDSHASRLRRKLCRGPGDQFVVNVWGVGYRLLD